MQSHTPKSAGAARRPASIHEVQPEAGGQDPGNWVEKRRRRREMAIVLAAGLAVVAFALWEVGRPGARSAAGNVLSFLLINLNIVLLLLVVFLVVRNLLRLVLERRRGIMGSHLRSRLVLAFVTIALLPAVVMVMVSFEFVSNGIDDWLGRQVEASLGGAYRLARTYYQSVADSAVAHARAVAAEIDTGKLLDPANEVTLRTVVADEQSLYALGTVKVLDPDGKLVLASYRGEAADADGGGDDAALVADAVRGDDATRVESQGTSDIIRGAAAIRGDGGRVVGAVIVNYVVRESPRAWSAQILESFREFRRMKLSKQPLKNLYLITMLLASVVVVFSATWLGLYLARGITEPIGRLAAATREVAGGRLDVALPEEGGDEVGTLVRSFNAMTAELKRGRNALEERRVYIENVLANIDAGVVSLDPEGRIGTANPAALALLALKEEGIVGRSAEDVFEEAGYPEVVSLLRDVLGGRLVPGSGVNMRRAEDNRTLLVTATNLRRGRGPTTGSVLFFEDVSQIREMQRMEAWREVARRIAHEIKNPLTPIQLSAQRLGRRLAGQLDEKDTALVRECVATIVSEVDGLKRLVNEFSQFARQASGDKQLQDLNALVEETVPLFRQARPDIDIAFEKTDELPRVILHRDSVKRSLVNLLDNAVAALAQVQGPPRAITVATRHDEILSRVILEVADTGPGIPRELRARIFEPYFSTKAEGTGLGLAIVASMAADHHAYLRVRANEPRGTRFAIEFPAGAVQQRV
ncbi:MAG: HAMP domain-containing protein [Deltaproteobacteria bacterium]|nr:HAMP domain-containing protein [Deltaproteobacteria bacterium]